MGIAADTMAEVVARTANDPAGSLTDIRAAGSVELISDAAGKVWLNVDGVCLARINATAFISVDTTLTDPAFKLIKP